MAAKIALELPAYAPIAASAKDPIQKRKLLTLPMSSPLRGRKRIQQTTSRLDCVDSRPLGQRQMIRG